MKVDIKIPSPGESISEVEIASWLVEDGDYVEKDQAIAELDSDKATLELPAEESGTISLKAEEGDTVAVGDVVGTIDTDAEKPEKDEDDSAEEAAKEDQSKDKKEKEETAKADKKQEARAEKEEEEKGDKEEKDSHTKGHPSPAAKKLMDENDVKASQVNGTGKDGRITKQDVVDAMSGGIKTDDATGWGGTRDTKREKMSMLRRKVAERLVSVKNETAMLTTFNEIDMRCVVLFYFFQKCQGT